MLGQLEGEFCKLHFAINTLITPPPFFLFLFGYFLFIYFF